MAKQTGKPLGRPKTDDALESQIAVRVSADVRNQLESKAQKLDRSVGWVLRKAIEEWLQRNP